MEFDSVLDGLTALFTGDISGIMALVIAAVKASPTIELVNTPFVIAWTSISALVLSITIVSMITTLFVLMMRGGRDEKSAAKFMAAGKVFLLSWTLPAMTVFALWVSELAANGIGSWFISTGWEETYSGSFSITSAIGMLILAIYSLVIILLLWIEITVMQFMIPIGIIGVELSLVTILRAGPMSNFGAKSMAFVLTGITLKPVLTLLLGGGGSIINGLEVDGGVKALLAIVLLTISLTITFKVFSGFENRVRSYVENKIKVQGNVDTHQKSSSPQRIAREVERAVSDNVDVASRMGSGRSRELRDSLRSHVDGAREHISGASEDVRALPKAAITDSVISIAKKVPNPQVQAVVRVVDTGRKIRQFIKRDGTDDDPHDRSN